MHSWMWGIGPQHMIHMVELGHRELNSNDHDTSESVSQQISDLRFQISQKYGTKEMDKTLIDCRVEWKLTVSLEDRFTNLWNTDNGIVTSLCTPTTESHILMNHVFL